MSAYKVGVIDMTTTTEVKKAGIKKTGGQRLQDKIRLAVIQKVGPVWTLQFYGETFHLPDRIQTIRQVKSFCQGVMGFDGVIELPEKQGEM